MVPARMFDEAVEGSMRDRRALLAFVDSFDQAQWKPPDGEWSIAEGLERIALTEPWVRAHLVEALQEAAATGNWDNAPAERKMSREALRRREQGFVAASEHLFPPSGI